MRQKGLNIPEHCLWQMDSPGRFQNELVPGFFCHGWQHCRQQWQELSQRPLCYDSCHDICTEQERGASCSLRPSVQTSLSCNDITWSRGRQVDTYHKASGNASKQYRLWEVPCMQQVLSAQMINGRPCSTQLTQSWSKSFRIVRLQNSRPL